MHAVAEAQGGDGDVGALQGVDEARAEGDGRLEAGAGEAGFGVGVEVDDGAAAGGVLVLAHHRDAEAGRAAGVQVAGGVAGAVGAHAAEVHGGVAAEGGGLRGVAAGRGGLVGAQGDRGERGHDQEAQRARAEGGA